MYRGLKYGRKVWNVWTFAWEEVWNRKGYAVLCYGYAILMLTLTGFLPQFLEEALVEDEGHAADLLHLGLRRRVPVLEVGGDGDGQLPTELLALEPWRRTGSVHRPSMIQVYSIGPLKINHLVFWRESCTLAVVDKIYSSACSLSALSSKFTHSLSTIVRLLPIINYLNFPKGINKVFIYPSI